MRIPKGTGFVDADNSKTGDPIGPSFLIVANEAGTLPLRPGCVTIAAVVRENPKGFAITTPYAYALPCQFVGPEIIGRIGNDFR